MLHKIVIKYVTYVNLIVNSYRTNIEDIKFFFATEVRLYSTISFQIFKKELQVSKKKK